MPSEDLNITVREEGDTVHLALSGEVDFGNVAELRAAILQQANGEPRKVVIDLGGVTFLDSMGLSVLIQGKRSVEGNGGRLAIVNPGDRVRHVLQLAGVDEYLLA